MSDPVMITDIRNFRCFEDLTDAEAQDLVEHLEPVHLDIGHVLFRQGEVGNCVYLLLSGHVQIRIAVPNQADRVLTLLDPGAIFGEVSLLLNEPRTATAIATNSSEVWKISHDAFESALKEQKSWAVKFLWAISKVLARRLSSADQDLVWIITDMHTHEAKPQVSKAHELENLRNRLFSQWSF